MQVFGKGAMGKKETAEIAKLLGIDEALAKQLDRIHKKHFGDNYEKVLSDQFAYRKTHCAYLKEALAKDIDFHAALNFHDEVAEPVLRGVCGPREGGQMPSKVIHVNSSMDRSSEILSHKAHVEKIDGKNVYVGGAFTISINVMEIKHFPEDFQPSAYMNGHMITDKKSPYAPPYEPFIAPFGSENKLRGRTVKDEIALLASRRGQFIGQYKDAGFHIEDNGGTPYLLSNIGDKVQRTYFPLVLHDTRDCEYYVYEGGKRMAIADWFASKGLSDHPFVKNDLEALELHRKEKPYFDDYVNLLRKRKKIECTDSRECNPRNNTRSTIRIIGAFLTNEERKRLLGSEGLEYITDGVHFGCGYLTTAMKLHEAGMEIGRIFEKGIAQGKAEEVAQASRFFKQGIELVVGKSWKAFDLKQLVKELESISGKPLTGGTAQLLHELLKADKADYREIARHMSERGLLEWDSSKGTIVMPAALKVDAHLGQESKLLPHNRETEGGKAAEQQKAYYESITVQVARDVEESWIASRIELEDETGKKCDVKVRVVIKDYSDDVSYLVKNGGLYDPYTKKQMV